MEASKNQPPVAAVYDRRAFRFNNSAVVVRRCNPAVIDRRYRALVEERRVGFGGHQAQF
jgi:hypothetical protein